MRESPSISTPAIPDLVASLGPIFGRRIAIEASPSDQRTTAGFDPANFYVTISWGMKRWEFAVEAKTRNTPRVLDEALRQARRRADESGRLPMVIVPFLGEKRLERLDEEGISGLDLCGNGLIIIPGRIFLRRTGQPNRYPESRPARFAYRGATSLVPRVFLRRAAYSSVSEIRDEIEAAGGVVAFSTVSKALARLEDDLIVDRSGRRIVLVQPDTLLDALVENYAAPKPARTSQLKTPLQLGDFFRLAQTPTAGSGSPLRVVLSGASTQDRYSAGLRADVPTIYTDDLGELKQRIGEAWKVVDRFANLKVIETRDPSPYFDARRDDGATLVASPLQAYLELATAGDKRDAEMATQIRASILQNLSR